MLYFKFSGVERGAVFLVGTQFITYIHYVHTLLNGAIQGQFTSKLSMGEIRHQHTQAPLAAAISPLAISPSTLMNEMRP